MAIEVGNIVDGTVSGITKFGVFVDFLMSLYLYPWSKYNVVANIFLSLVFGVKCYQK